jgi:hypothetical protein
MSVFAVVSVVFACSIGMFWIVTSAIREANDKGSGFLAFLVGTAMLSVALIVLFGML